MRFPYLKAARVKLQERKNACIRAKYSSAQQYVVFVAEGMFRTFATLALSGRPDESWGDMALKTQQVLDACLQSAAREGQSVEIDATGDILIK